jgi:hypothetical protein
VAARFVKGKKIEGFEKGAQKVKQIEPDAFASIVNKTPFGKLADSASVRRQEANILKGLMEAGLTKSTANALIESAKTARARERNTSMMFLQMRHFRDAAESSNVLKKGK